MTWIPPYNDGTLTELYIQCKNINARTLTKLWENEMVRTL